MKLPKSLMTSVLKFNVSTNDYKLMPANQTVGGGSILVLTLPNNSISDLKSLYITGLKQVLTIGGTGTAGFSRFLPLFNRCLVEMGGKVLPSCNYLPEVQTVLNQIAETNASRNRKIIYGSGSTVSVDDSTASPFIIDEFPGTFIGTTSQPLMDMSLVPEMKISFYLDNGNACLVGSAGTVTGATYALTNVYGSIKTYSIDDGGEFYNAQRRMLASQETRQITFTNYTSVLNPVPVTGGTVSLDIISNNISGAIALPLLKQGAIGTLDGVSKTSTCFARVVSAAGNWQFSLNSVSCPVFLASASDAYPIALNAMKSKYSETHSIDALCTSAAQWLTPYWTACASFELPTVNPDGIVFTSGFNSLNQNARVSFTYNDSGGSATSLLLLVKTNPVVVIQANKEFTIVP
jgi:hypothetical protein